MSALETEEDDTTIEIEPPAPKRKKIATLTVFHILHTLIQENVENDS